MVLKYAPQSCRKDRDIVLEAVKQNGWALQFAHKDLCKGDPEFVQTAVKTDWSALLYAPCELKVDRNVLLEAASQLSVGDGEAATRWKAWIAEAQEGDLSIPASNFLQFDSLPQLHCANWPHVRLQTPWHEAQGSEAKAGPRYRCPVPKIPSS